jgi:hypothetical protein
MKYLFLVIFSLLFNFAAPQAAPLLVFSSGANTIYAHAPILPAKTKKQKNIKPRKPAKNNNYKGFLSLVRLMTLFFTPWAILSGFLIADWLSDYVSLVGIGFSTSLFIGIFLLVVSLVVAVIVLTINGRYAVGKKFKIWVPILYFLGITAIVSAPFFIIFGVLLQIWLFWAIAVSLLVFGIIGLILSTYILHRYKHSYIVRPASPDSDED